MQRTFCDRCGAECQGFHLDLHGVGYNTTSDGRIAEELYPTKRHLQLCKACTDALADWGIDFGLVPEAVAMQAKASEERGGMDFEVRAHP